MPALKWTEEAIRQEALKYQNRAAFASGNNHAYKRSGKLGIRESVCSHMTALRKPNGHWTRARCMDDALQYADSSAWEAANKSAYVVATRSGWLPDCIAHMTLRTKPPGYWTPNTIATAAAEYEGRADFWREEPRAHSRARELGILDAVCAHMVPQYTHSDSVYIWRSVGEYYKGKPVYKIGVTAAKWGDTRIRQVASTSRKTAELVILQEVRNVHETESVLHILGEHPGYTEGDGYTEFRALSDNELQEAIQYIEEVAA